MRVLGIYRESQFSPGKVDADAAILDAVLAALREKKLESSTVMAERIDSHFDAKANLVLAMCQGEHALERLAHLEKTGALVINSALAIRNCYRDLMGAGLTRAGIPAPRGVLLDLSRPEPRLEGIDATHELYVKRGDLHALGPEDVQRVDRLADIYAVLAAFVQRGIRKAYVQEAVSGLLVKFYGVSGGEYFAALPETGQLSFQAEQSLRQAAERAAAALGLEVWGGDAIVQDNSIMLVDFNDWPSFSRVRVEAARAIARRCMLLLRRRDQS
ncbi:MAG: hypothetical protein IVW54_00345 [Candidatus Binataceae bacterium]|nr:hypothetical protein [Candidatus Binataceae bacterium]